MEVKIFEGKSQEEILNNILESLKLKEEDLYVSYEEVKGGLFKSTSYKYKVILKTDVVDYIKKYLEEILNDMGITTTFESRIRENQLIIKMYSNNNAILIGKNGQTLEALQTIIKNVVHKQIGIFPLLILDVENYKEKHEQAIERLAKNVAKEVLKTKTEVKLESMNSYERRIVHNILTDFKGIKTISEGEEPNRSVVIKPE